MRRARVVTLALGIGVATASCASTDAIVVPAAPAPTITSTTTAPPPAENEALPSRWATVTRSPVPVDAAHESRETELLARCGVEDAGLVQVARELAATRARGLGTPEPARLVAELRAAGEPHVRPRLVIASGRAPVDVSKLTSELSRSEPGGGRAAGKPRCGVGVAPTPHGGEVVVVLRVDALADLSPLPTRARTGQWLTLEARLHVAASSAKLVVLGPHGLPRTVPTSLDPHSGLTRARFVLDQPGAFTVQLLADLAEGPRPLLEARVFADVAPFPVGEEPPAPGEELVGGNADGAALARMVGAVRAFEGVGPLSRDEKLDALAKSHAERMRKGRAVAHDVGDGDFRDRFLAEGTLDARAVGENVAHASTLALAHRALHASPSHRINLLRADYTHIGIGIAQAEDGSVYVCETFASARRSP